MAGLSLSLMGAFRGSLDGQPLPGFRTLKVQALLIYLASESQTAHRREALMTLLWPGLPETSARINLRQIIYHLRQLIPEVAGQDSRTGIRVPLLVGDRNLLQINPDASLETDVQRFEQLVDQTASHSHPEILDCSECSSALAEAVSLYRGDFLSDFYLDDSNEFEEWAAVTRESLRRRMLDALELLTNLHLHRQEYSQARACAERQTQIDDLRESAYQQLIKILALTGKRSEAVNSYETYRRLLAKELSMAPAASTTELYEKIQAGDSSLESAPRRGVRGYDLLEEIGSGTYGTVYRAYQPAFARHVAVKVIQPRYANNPDFIRRFEAESQTVASLDNPYIVSMYDYWREPDGAYLAMRLYRGGNLETALKMGTWSLTQTMKVIDQVASALTAIHGQGIIHQNLKPANILLDEDNNAYLADFSVINQVSGDMRSSGYFAPEQLASKALTPQVDVYSLGLVLYEMLTGEKPFVNAPQLAGAQAVDERILPSVRTERFDFPSQVDIILQRATAIDPGERYPSAQALAVAFSQAISGSASGIEEAKTIAWDLPVVPIGANPYKGLRSFEETDTAEFFGREALVEQLVKHLAEHRFLAVVGPSGSGKSSAIRAGLIPALRSGAVPGSECWFFVTMVPGAQPFEALEQALLPIAVNPPPTLVEPMIKDERGIGRTLKRILPDESDVQLLLVIDQFEELYTLVSDERQRDQFIDGLLAAVRAPRSQLRVVIALRADFYDRPLQSQALGQLINDHMQVVLPLSPYELERAVRIPAERAGVDLETGLMSLIATDVREQPGALPLLQYALTELFEARQDHTMTKAAYQAMGGIPGALSKRAEVLFQALDGDGQAAARQMFLRMVTLGEGVEDTRRRVLLSELEALELTSHQAASLESAVETFGRRRLLTFDRNPTTRSPTVEVAHEALLREWPRLRGWLDVSRDDVRHQRRLAAYALEWQQAGKDPDFLMSSGRLEQFAGWAASTSLALTPEEHAFLNASLAQREVHMAEEEARRERELETVRKLAETERARAEEKGRSAERLRQRALFLSGALVIAFLLAFVAGFFGHQASVNAARAADQARIASARELSAASVANLQVDPERSILLALQAVQEKYFVDGKALPEAENALHRAVEASRVQMTLIGNHGPVNRVAFSPDGITLAAAFEDGNLMVWNSATGEPKETLPIGKSAIKDVVFSPDGKLLAVASADGTTKIYDSGTFQLVHDLIGHKDVVNSVAFNANGSLLATASKDKTVIVWDVATWSESFELCCHDAGVLGVAFSPDGTRLATSSNDRTAKVWDLTTRRVLFTMAEHNLIVPGIIFSPDGRRLVTAAWDSTAKIRDPETGEVLLNLEGHTNAIQDVAYSQDGRYLATGSLDTTAKVWDASTGQVLLTLAGHTGTVSGVAFSPDGTRLATGSTDGSVRIWNITLTPNHESTIMPGHTWWVFRIAISPDGTQLATAGLDKQVKIWDIKTGKLLQSLPGINVRCYSVAFSPDGNQLATAGEDGIKIWNLSDDKILFSQPGATTGVVIGNFTGNIDVAFSPDGKLLAVARSDNLVQIWDIASGNHRDLLGHQAGVTSVSFSPDGTRLATSSEDATAIVWDVASGTEKFPLKDNNFIWRVDYSPDGKYIATASRNGTAKIWDASDGTLLKTLIGHKGTVFDVVFSPDSKNLATSSGDGTARIWDVATGVELLNLSGHTKLVSSAVFTPDGKRLITSGMDGTAIVYVLPLEDLIGLARDRLTRTWRLDECQRFLHLDQCPSPP